MRQQSQIQRTLGGAEGIARISTLLERERFSGRSDLGRRVCEEFDFRDRLGRLQLSGCLNALRVIEQRCDSIVLPVAGTAVPRPGSSSARAALPLVPGAPPAAPTVAHQSRELPSRHTQRCSRPRPSLRSLSPWLPYTN